MTKMTWPTPLRYAGALVLVAGLAACGGSGSASSTTAAGSSSGSSSSSTSTSASPTSAASSSAAPSPTGRTLVVTVKGNQVTPTPRTIDLAVGETITLTVTSDHADQLHVHGFDIEKDLVAGQPLSIELTGQSPGVYEVETHHPPLRLLKIAVR